MKTILQQKKEHDTAFKEKEQHIRFMAKVWYGEKHQITYLKNYDIVKEQSLVNLKLSKVLKINKTIIAQLKHKVPLWADLAKICDLYMLRDTINETEGREGSNKLVVDHIVPRKHKLVCGLHNEFNLQLITLSENSIKHNKHII